VIAQVGYLVFGPGGSAGNSVKSAIKQSVDKQLLPISRAEQLKVQAAVMAYRTATGKLPKDLKDLVPTYIDKIPIDPTTKQQLAYRIENDRPIVGSAESELTNSETTLVSVDGSTPMTKSEQSALIATLSEDLSQPKFVYVSEGKRDPFLPFDFMPKLRPGATVLEQYTYEQLKVTAIIATKEEPKAIVEDQSGLGFTVKKGTKIGPIGGEIIEIFPDKIVIVETEEDFTGAKKTRTVEMLLRRDS
jgi:Tfp pilus assembly protein PilP